MNAIFSQLITQLNSSVFVLLGVLAVVAVLLFKLGGWKEKFFHYSERMNKFDSLNEKMIEISTKVDLIYNNTNPRKVVSSNSPLSLTELGKEIAEACRAQEIFQRCLPDLEKAVNDKCGEATNAYDIQLVALDVADNFLPGLFDADEINRIKNAAYRFGIRFEDILPIFGIFTRDHILSQRGIPVIDVDKHAPPLP